METSVWDSPYAGLLITVLAASMVASFLRDTFRDAWHPKVNALVSLAIGAVIGIIVAWTSEDQVGMLVVCGTAGAAADFLPGAAKDYFLSRKRDRGPQHTEYQETELPPE